MSQMQTHTSSLYMGRVLQSSLSAAPQTGGSSKLLILYPTSEYANCHGSGQADRNDFHFAYLRKYACYQA